MTYDIECHRLARYFLADQVSDGLITEAEEESLADTLAQLIQRTIEDFLEERSL